TVAAERMLVNLMRRAQVLKRAGEDVPASEPLAFFLGQQASLDTLKADRSALQAFGRMDDHDIWGAIKMWRDHNDKILSHLSAMLMERRLFGIVLSNEPIRRSVLENIRDEVIKRYHTLRVDATYLYSHGTVTNEAYTEGEKINILTRSGE